MVTTLVGPSGAPISTNGINITGRPPLPTKVRLVTGLNSWRGTVSEEYLPELKPWSKLFKVYQEMEDDAVIGALYESVKSPLMDSKFEIQPASNSTADIEAAEWVKQNTIESTAFSWQEHLNDGLEMLSYGFALTEKVMSKSMSGRLWMEDLMPVGQETLREWGPMNDKGRPESFLQFDPQPGRANALRVAPMSKLLHFTFRGRKRNPMGRAISRSIYRPWYFKKNLEVVEAIGAERDVGNMPVVTLGEGFYSPGEMTELETNLSNLRINETAYIIMPNDTEISPFGSGGKVYDIRTMIRDYQHLIRQRFFMDFISFGSESVGTQALAKEVTGFFSITLGAIQQTMLRIWNQDLIPWMFKWNPGQFIGITTLPIMIWHKPGKINIQNLAQSVATLLSTNTIHWNKATEDSLRESLELPPITDKEITEARDTRLIQQSGLGLASAAGGGIPKDGETATPTNAMQ